MKIFIDARYTVFPTHFGVSRYCAELAFALAKIHSITLIICDERQLTMLPKAPHVKLNNPLSLFEELFVARKLNKYNPDVVFSPLQTMGSWGRKFKLILTMHDTIYYDHPSPPMVLPWYARFAWWLSYKALWPQRVLLNRADVVVTVSETSKKEIERLRLTKRPIGIVGNAPDKPAAAHRSSTIKKELVYVSSFMKYKNHETLVKMINQLPDYKVHFTSPVWADRKEELLKLAERPEQIVFWNGASDEDMYKLLSECAAAVHSSTAEGFGLPLIEAMSMGAPVICSDIPIFHEVAEDAAFAYCNPLSADEYVAAVRRLEQHPELAAEYSKRGIEQAKKYSWDHSAEQLLAIIKNIVK